MPNYIIAPAPAQRDWYCRDHGFVLPGFSISLPTASDVREEKNPNYSMLSR